MNSIEELARRWSELLLSELQEEIPTRAVRETGSVLRPPASEAHVAAAERRLACTLPPSYREFLLCSDGAYADLYGVSWAALDDYSGGRGASVVGAGFLPVSDLRWLKDASPEAAAIYAETDLELDSSEYPRPARSDGPWDPWPWGPYARGLMISVDHAPGLTCLVPVEDEEEWQVWDIHKEVAVAYPSFRVMLERFIAEREPVTTLEELEVVLEEARTGDERLAWARLTRTTTPDAVPTLVRLLKGGGSLGLAAIFGLARIGTEDALAALDETSPPTRERALLLAGNQGARDRLAAEGRYWPLAQLGDPRAADLAAQELTTNEDPPNTAFIAVSRAGQTEHVATIARFLHAAPSTAVWAARALAQLGDPRGHDRLVELADEDGVTGLLARRHLEILRVHPDEPW